MTPRLLAEFQRGLAEGEKKAEQEYLRGFDNGERHGYEKAKDGAIKEVNAIRDGELGFVWSSEKDADHHFDIYVQTIKRLAVLKREVPDGL